jgi:hypothetical protein
MAIAMILRFPGVTPAEYEELRRITEMDAHPPEGGLFHVAAHDGEALRITDVWESAEAFERFAQERLVPALAEAGIEGEPQIEVYPAINVFAPAFEPTYV